MGPIKLFPQIHSHDHETAEDETLDNRRSMRKSNFAYLIVFSKV